MAKKAEALRCLVADDEPQIGGLIREILTRRGFACEVVTDGEAARTRLRDGAFDLAVLDIMMPGRTGLELLLELRRQDGTPTPVVLMSSYLSEEILERCGTLGSLAFLQKPFGLADLNLAIERAGLPLPA